MNAEKYRPSEPLPQHLGHKPVYAIPYEKFDGIYAGGTDARYLSVGLAQWDDNSVSVKVMRHTGEKWSRQAEELPLHRVIDMTLLVAKSLFAGGNAIEFPANSLSNQDSPLHIERDGNRNKAEMEQFNEFINEEREGLKRRLNVLADALNDLRQRGML